MTRILALDTSTEACSCALYDAGDVRETLEMIPRQHANRLLPMIKALLQDAGLRLVDLDAIAFGRGPGSFTGLRIAAGVTQGLALATGLPVIPVSTLAAMALQAHVTRGCESVLACLDARIDEVYWAPYHVEARRVTALADEQLCKPELMQERYNFDDSPVMAAAGSGLAYKDRFSADVQNRLGQLFPDIVPGADRIAELAAVAYAAGEFIQPDEAAPLYLRDKVTRN